MRRLDSEIESFKKREDAVAQARAEILRLAQGKARYARDELWMICLVMADPRRRRLMK